MIKVFKKNKGMTSNRFWSFVFISIFLIAGCKHPESIFNLPLGKEELRGASIRVKNNKLWNTEKKRTTSFNKMIDVLSRKSIVYIGEKHDNIVHHQFQLDIIKALYEKNPNIIIAMEMFQKPSQKVLDQRVRGEITEDSFQDKVEWYYQWNVPYDYYKGIFNFSMEKGLPILAINISRNLLGKIMTKGIESLTERERKLLPTLTPISKEYKHYIRRNYKGHPGESTPAYENFMLTQRLWDDTMAETVASIIDKSPVKNLQMIVLTGGGHIIYDLGIPKRVFANNNLPYATVIPVEVHEKNGHEVDLGIGSFILGTEPSAPLPPIPFLGVTFPVVKEENKGVLIKSVIKKSIAETSGIKAGDIMIRFAGKELNGIHTLTRLIRENGWNRTVEIVLLRDDQKVVVEATFPPEPSKEDGRI